jgi:flagellar secretion chaperone FliS
MDGKPVNAARVYQEIDRVGRTEGATPHALVALLYSELSNALDVMARATETGDAQRRLAQHERASSILHALEAGLDRTRGGSLADALSGIYRQMRQRLLAARAGDMGALGEVREGVSSLAGAWESVRV